MCFMDAITVGGKGDDMQISMEVPFKITVEDAECEICLKMVEIWLNTHPYKDIEGEKQKDGSVKLKIIDKEWAI